ncbi:MAG: 16S rRNA (adenine(1518)-N(6)/adenine(1519)-N(6))-dimethyltransferase RsmA [Alphaproteobacteria bacterium]|nr:16S rRNA (adenine(1518)-N(6)/adenine(1519)-N(6))-dimethyltransferase RsmA [Alphaproteobacteria bacterium]MCW5739127.1 16S rRNA (adenine(1518)-N(6)/adenine(1519)-N(6))-dimethyltransferase RsmA [Alphaproteobacteria bacterium]
MARRWTSPAPAAPIRPASWRRSTWPPTWPAAAVPDDPWAALPPLREVIARHELAARKALGQHFLLDGNLTDRIARAAGDLSSGTVIEVGPGPGGLTRSLLRAGAARVVAVERDRRAVAALADLAAAFPDRLKVREADALETDLASLGVPPRRIVANLPYNVATPLLIGWLRQAQAFESFTLMFQKEVVERLAARPRSKAYGRLSVLAQHVCEVTPLFDIAASAFVPPPKVVSSVVRLVPRPQAAGDLSRLEAVTAAAFGQRRKMLRSSLKGVTGDPEVVLNQLGLSPTSRAEELAVGDFVRLAQSI